MPQVSREYLPVQSFCGTMPPSFFVKNSTRVARDLTSFQKSLTQSHPVNGSIETPKTPADNEVHVAVVGAGFAGLRCADVLLRHGVKVTIFEGRDRIGGRAHQVELGGHLFDVGPNWIHGTDQNPVFQIAKDVKATFNLVEEQGAIYDSKGSQLEQELADWLSDKIWAIFKDAFKYSDTNSDQIGSGQSLLRFVETQMIECMTPKGYVEKWPYLQALLREMAGTWGPFVGDPVARQSLKFFYLEECIDGETPFVASTYKTIVEQVGETATEGAKILFNEEVVSISSSKDNGNRATTITTAKGTTATFDQVVVTCPLGWLKNHHKSTFSPPLPTRLSLAIRNLTYGRLEKIYVTFPSAFWHTPESPELFTFLTPSYLPSYIPSTTKSSSTQTIISLSNFPPPHAHPTLLFYLHGPYATAMVEAIKPYPPDSAEYASALHQFTHPFYSRLPNYSSASTACIPTAIYGTQWQSDPMAGNGSYINFQIGLEEGDKDILCLREGIPEQGIWFAGEHTAPFVALGTTTGAYWAGEGVARRILGACGVPVTVDVQMKSIGELQRKIQVAARHALQDQLWERSRQ